MIITLNVMVELLRMEIILLVGKITMCDFVCWVAREVCYFIIFLFMYIFFHKLLVSGCSSKV